MNPNYKRVLLKISGEALAGDEKQGIDFKILHEISKQIKKCTDLEVQIGVVVGGGNFWRGRTGGDMDRTKADQMGMLATVMNSLAMADSLERLGVQVRVQTAISMDKIAELYVRDRAINHLEKGRVVIFGGGTGSPFFSTDTAAAMRAAEINAEILLKATMVDGVYNKDPKEHPDAMRYDRLDFFDILNKDLKIMDTTAASLCKDNNIKVLVFNIFQPENIYNAIAGKSVGTIVC
ncbi:MAG: UMP kinase [Clostridia bacterium]|nr:UMP kinase [Clostridia bacterium]